MNTVFAECFADELEKVACAMESSGGAPEAWSDRFKGTPLQQAAINLELQQATSDMQFDEMEAQQREQEEAEQAQRAQRPSVWRQRSIANDKFRIARKQMERQLLVAKLQQQQSDQDEGWQDLDQVQKTQQPGRLPPRPMQNMQQGQGAVPQQQEAASRADQPQSG